MQLSNSDLKWQVIIHDKDKRHCYTYWHTDLLKGRDTLTTSDPLYGCSLNPEMTAFHILNRVHRWMYSDKIADKVSITVRLIDERPIEDNVTIEAHYEMQQIDGWWEATVIRVMKCEWECSMQWSVDQDMSRSLPYVDLGIGNKEWTLNCGVWECLFKGDTSMRDLSYLRNDRMRDWIDSFICGARKQFMEHGTKESPARSNT